MEFLDNYSGRLMRAWEAGQKPIEGPSDDDGVATLVISFTAKGRPFIPTRFGFNREEDRCYIRPCRFTRELELDLLKTRIELQNLPGGRVFIGELGSYIKLWDGSKVEISSIGLGRFANLDEYIQTDAYMLG